jgi:hypothetical protein
MPRFARATRPRPAMRPWLPWLTTLIGVMFGAALGIALHFANNAAGASALLRIDQPLEPEQVLGGYTPTEDTRQAYISGEIAYLTSGGFDETVAKELNETSTPDVSASQNGRSSIITVTASAATFPEAERIVNSAIKAYTDHVQQQRNERYQVALQSLDKTIDLLSADAERNATRLGELQAQRIELEVQAQRPPGIQVDQPPSQTPRGFPGLTLGAIAGGVFGGLIALAATLRWRRYRGETSLADPAASE